MSQQMDNGRLASLRRRLLEEKRELEARIQGNDHYQLTESMRDALDELSVNDNHPADLGTEMFERGKDLALLERDAFRMERIEAALERMKTGEYGICKECGAFIPLERLEALPTAAYCIEHEPRQDTSKRRPVQEEFLQPPFGRTSVDEISQTAYDGEDAWQDVAMFGTSNTPALAEDHEIDDYNHVYVEADEQVGFVEPIENFLATDITGSQTFIVRGSQYKRYLDAGEGEDLLEPDIVYDDGR